MLRAYQSPSSAADCGPQCAQIPNGGALLPRGRHCKDLRPNHWRPQPDTTSLAGSRHCRECVSFRRAPFLFLCALVPVSQHIRGVPRRHGWLERRRETKPHFQSPRSRSVTGFANPRNGPGTFRSAVRSSPKKSNSQSFNIGAVGSGEADFQESSKRLSSNATSP